MTTSDYTSEIPYGYCHCGCGQKTNIATHTNSSRDAIKGKPVRFANGHRTKPTLESQFISFWSHVAITADDNQCWLWLGSCNEKGYGYSRIGNNVRAHRIAWMYPNYLIPDGMEVCHSCDTRNCCNPKHLFLGTHQDNMDDMNSKGRGIYLSGESIGTSKLTNAQVAEIRQLYISGVFSYSQLGREFNTSKSNIARIVKHQSRKNG